MSYFFLSAFRDDAAEDDMMASNIRPQKGIDVSAIHELLTVVAEVSHAIFVVKTGEFEGAESRCSNGAAPGNSGCQLSRMNLNWSRSRRVSALFTNS